MARKAKERRTMIDNSKVTQSLTEVRINAERPHKAGEARVWIRDVKASAEEPDGVRPDDMADHITKFQTCLLNAIYALYRDRPKGDLTDAAGRPTHWFSLREVMRYLAGYAPKHPPRYIEAEIEALRRREIKIVWKSDRGTTDKYVLILPLARNDPDEGCEGVRYGFTAEPIGYAYALEKRQILTLDVSCLNVEGLRTTKTAIIVRYCLLRRMFFARRKGGDVLTMECVYNEVTEETGKSLDKTEKKRVREVVEATADAMKDNGLIEWYEWTVKKGRIHAIRLYVPEKEGEARWHGIRW